MTRRPAAHARTRANIIRALDLGVPLRVSIVTTDRGDAETPRMELEQLGVTRIGIDHVRPYGRGLNGQEPDCSGLCGACGDGRAAVGPNGNVAPCVFSTWMSAGNVHREPLADVLAGPDMHQARNEIWAGKKDVPRRTPSRAGLTRTPVHAAARRRAATPATDI